MRRILEGLCAVAVLAACGGGVAFTVTKSSLATVEPCDQGQVNDLGFRDFDDVKVRSSAEWNNSGINPEDVDSVTIDRLRMRVKSPSDSDLAYLTHVVFYAEAPNQPKVKIAERNGFPSGTRDIDFDVSGVELKPYVTADSMRISSEMTAAGCPAKEQTIETTITFSVDTSKQGVQHAVDSIPFF